MQVSPVSRAAPPKPQRDRSRQTLVASLVLSLTPPLTPFHADPSEQTDQLRARRKRSVEPRRSAAQADRPRVAQTLRDRERLMRPGSHAFRQALRREQRLRQATPAPRPSPADSRSVPAAPADDAPADPQPARGDSPRPAPAPQPVDRASSDTPAPRPGTPSPAAPPLPAERGTRATQNTHAAPSAAPQPQPASALVSAETGVTSVTRSGTAGPSAPSGRAPGHAPAERVEPAPLSGAEPRGRTPHGRRVSARARTDPAEARAQQQQRIERIVRVVRHSLRNGQTRTTLRLDPPALGNLRIDIELRDSLLHLRFEPAHPLAHRLLNRQVDELAAALRAAGLEPQRIEVQPAPGTLPQSMHADVGARHGGGPATGGHSHAAHSAPDATVTTDQGDAPNAPIHTDSSSSDGVLHTTMVNVWA